MTQPFAPSTFPNSTGARSASTTSTSKYRKAASSDSSGPNGAGKTTTIKILMNLVQPTTGRAEVLGRDSRHLRPVDFTRIGYVSENQEMPDWMTVDQLLAYLQPFYPNWDRRWQRR